MKTWELLHAPAVVLLSLSVLAALPRPQNLKMDAVNTRYILHWDWSPQQPNVTFTAEYSFSEESFYTRRCDCEPQKHCNFSQLDYWATYMLRVRAEGWRDQSDWTLLYFSPDENATLGPPSHLRVEPGNMMVTVSFKEPMTEQGDPMSSELDDMAFRLQYWDAQTPDKKLQLQVDSAEHTLQALQPWTEYCLQVSAFSQNYDKTSPYTQPCCATTTGDRAVWPILLAAVFTAGLLTAISIIYTCYCRSRQQPPAYKIPPSIVSPPAHPAALPEPEEDSCVVSAVLLTEVTRGLTQVNSGLPEVLEPGDSPQGSSSGDSGIYSGGGWSSEQ